MSKEIYATDTNPVTMNTCESPLSGMLSSQHLNAQSLGSWRAEIGKQADIACIDLFEIDLSSPILPTGFDFDVERYIDIDIIERNGCFTTPDGFPCLIDGIDSASWRIGVDGHGHRRIGQQSQRQKCIISLRDGLRLGFERGAESAD